MYEFWDTTHCYLSSNCFIKPSICDLRFVPGRCWTDRITEFSSQTLGALISAFGCSLGWNRSSISSTKGIYSSDGIAVNVLVPHIQEDSFTVILQTDNVLFHFPCNDKLPMLEMQFNGKAQSRNNPSPLAPLVHCTTALQRIYMGEKQRCCAPLHEVGLLYFIHVSGRSLTPFPT